MDYEIFDRNDDKNVKDEKNSSKVKLLYIFVFVLLIVLVVLFFIFFGGNESNQWNDIVLESNTLDLKIGESSQIKLIIDDNEKSEMKFNWVSNNPSIASVTDDGYVTGISKGEAIITIEYKLKKGDNRTLECYINVSGNEIVYQLNNSDWSKENAVITIDEEANSELSNFKYSLNCKDDCKYEDVVSNQIVIEDNGVNEVKIVATDKIDNQLEVNVTVKIDKKSPSIKLTPNGENIYSNSDKFEVCGTCTDAESGCEVKKKCNEYKETKMKEKISISDKVGNIGESSEYNVIIEKDKPVCTFTDTDDITIKVGEQKIITLECVDDISGIAASEVNLNNLQFSTNGIIEVTNINKSDKTNGYIYKIDIKGVNSGSTNIGLSSATIKDRAGNSQDLVESKNINVNPACTRARSCGCEKMSGWLSRGKQTITASCNSNPSYKRESDRLVSCTANITDSLHGICVWTCNYEVKNCQEYKCC